MIGDAVLCRYHAGGPYRYQANLCDALADLKVIATDVFGINLWRTGKRFPVDPFRTAVGLVSTWADAIGSITELQWPIGNLNVVGASVAVQAAAATQVHRTNTINGGAINTWFNGSETRKQLRPRLGNVSREVDRPNRAALCDTSERA